MDNKLKGLSHEQVAESRRKNGENVLTPPQRTSLLKLYIEKYHDPIIQILLVAAAISLCLSFVNGEYIETIGIILAVLLATTVGFYFEQDAAKKFNLLTLLDDKQKVKVRRDGHVQLVMRQDVVVGDIVIIETGDEIPADGKLLSSINLQVDESSLTGEPIATKSALNASHFPSEGAGDASYPEWMVLRSTMVMSGSGEMEVTAIGDETEIGKVARQSTEITNVKTPLSIQLDRLAKLISKVGTAISFAAFFVFLIPDMFSNDLWASYSAIEIAEKVLRYFMMAVTLIVMAVPEGLPMAVTLALALNMRRMLKGNNLVRKLHACETMGAVTVICTDKTGTLTQNRMQVIDKGFLFVDNTPDALEEIKTHIAVNTTAELNGEKGIGNPTETALLLWLKSQGVDYLQLRNETEIVAREPFSTERKYMSTTISPSTINPQPLTFIKGAPEIILSMCNMASDERQRIEKQLLDWQQQGLRTLAFAVKRTSLPQVDPQPSSLPPPPSSLISLQAICAISDPLRTDVPEAVEKCRQAGIEVKIVTGDTKVTAVEIARQIGILGNLEERGERREERVESDESVIEGCAFAALSDEEALQRARKIKVMCRARPTDKQRFVEMLQRCGEVVAVTGDGTNDAPALHYAHVGLSLGSGTNVAKEASDMTLLDDSFHSIANAVMWGRSLYHNIQRFLFFQLVVNVSALLLVLCGAFIGTELPLTVTQILWVNLIMDTFAALALASLSPRREVMEERPRKMSDFIITRSMTRAILSFGITFFAIMFIYLVYLERFKGSGTMIDAHELTLFFTTFVMLQVWNLFNAKALGSTESAFSGIQKERGLVFVLCVTVIVQVLIVEFGGQMFRTDSMSLMEWLTVTAATSIVIWIGEGIRLTERLWIRK